MNSYVYGYGTPGKERLIVVDLGVTFPDMDGTPGVDLILPDIAWLEERKAQIEAIFITHAHEDHVGAIGHYWERLGAPVYARPFTANIARRKMEEHGPSRKRGQGRWRLPRDDQRRARSPCHFLPISHSIPESAGLVIDTPEGRVRAFGRFQDRLKPRLSVILGMRRFGKRCQRTASRR